MSQIFYLLSKDEDTGKRNIVVFVPGQGAETADSDAHPNFDAIVDAVQADEPLDDILALFDTSQAVAKKFDQLTDRISVANGRVYLDGDEVDNSLTRQMVRFLEEGVDDWSNLVCFYENILANPQEHSREQLYTWLDRHSDSLTIDEEGYIIAYKGVTADFKSIHSGPGIVNGEEVNGQLDNSVGNTVAIPRSLVHHDPAVGCSTGLHVGTYEYASTFGSGQCVLVRVNPRDVVSVPTDCNAQKVRVCLYEVIDQCEAKLTSAVYSSDVDDDWDWDNEDYDDPYDEYDEDYCDTCGGPCSI